MIFYYIVTFVCFVVAIAHSAVVLLSLLLKKGANRKRYLRNFKKGNCVIIYLISIPLSFIGRLYANSGNIIENMFDSVNHVLNLMVLRYDVSAIKALMIDNSFYAFVVHVIYVLVMINATAFAFSIFAQTIWQSFCKVRFKFFGKKKVLFLSANDQNYKLYNSCDQGEKTLVVLKDGLSDEEKIENANKGKKDFDRFELYEKGVYNVILTTEKLIFSVLQFAKSKKVELVVNCGSDKANIIICKKLLTHVNGLEKQKLNEFKKIIENLHIFVYGDPLLANVYEDIVEDSYGCVSYVNVYQKNAIEFIEKYPFSAFMNGKQIDYESATLSPEVNVNVCIFGFGKTGRQLFLTSVANNQFITYANNKVVTKAVNYYAFDKDVKANNTFLNHGFFRFEQEFKNQDYSDYYPMPEKVAECEYFDCDIGDAKTYYELRRILTKNKLDANFIIICFGKDYQNVDFAQKILEKCREWGVENANVFVKSKSVNKQDTFIEEPNCYFFGNETECLYKYDNLLNGQTNEMALLRSYSYFLESQFAKNDYTEKDLQTLKQKAFIKWFSQSQRERDSSLYCVLSLRHKLNLMNFDLAPNSDSRKSISEKQFYERYAKNYPVTVCENVCVDGKCQIVYDFDFKPSLRTNFAILEHSRWNAFMISRGLVPASKNQILNEKNQNGKFTNGKNYHLRRHGNITTFEGLMQFANDIALRDGVSWQERDVIRYDYQIMDEAFWLSNKVGLKIVEKQ